MPRPTFVEIDESALQHNLSLARQASANARCWAVVKANAYGHGLEPAMRAFSAADGLALVEFDSAQQLRARGWTKPILLLEGPFEAGDLALAQSLDFSLVVHNPEQLAMFGQSASSAQINVYLKFNSGMNRLGFDAQGFRAAHQALSSNPRVRSITLMTHFANSDLPGGADRAWADFEAACYGLNGQRSTCNSAAVLELPKAQGDWVRPGILLYGASPFAQRSAQSLGLRAAMRFGSQLIAVQNLKAGDAVGYGSSFQAAAPMRIGVVACGYADGYPRHAPSGTPIVVAGVRSRTVGRVAMDMLMVDLGPIPSAQIGSEVQLWGPLLPIDEVAQHAGTIGYELMCAITPRVVRRAVP